VSLNFSKEKAPGDKVPDALIRMAILKKTLFNIITNDKETVYTFLDFFSIVELPAKPYE
jgi:hypothetical protein